MSIDLDKDMMNEETIKNKVILPLLLNKNDININNLSFEESFSIVIGRSKIDINKLSEIEKKKRPRYDILVSDKLQNKNLFIIEVKRDRLDLTDEDRDQAISYARLTHPITPIAITTNGKNNRVYNTITKEEIDKINIDNINYDISLDSENYYEAIKKLITFNEGCFKSFLENEYIENTQQLIAKDKEEEKAYFPKLFVENEELENEFGLFMRCNERAFSLIAQSGMGKSCWMCYKAKELIEGGSFVYFLRSIDIENDIISTITNNLNWGKGIPDFRTPKEAYEKISSIIGGKKIYVFVDGIDENENSAKTIEKFIRKLKNNFRLVTSCKIYSWKNFEYYENEKSRFIENLFTINLLKDENKKEGISNAFIISRFSEKQFNKILKKYKNEYNYEKEINKNLLQDFKRNAYLMRIAFQYIENNNNKNLNVSTKEIVSNFLNKMKSRFDFNDNEIIIINKLAEELLRKNKNTIKLEEFNSRTGCQITKKLFNSNIIFEKKINELEKEVGFYFSKLRDYIIIYKVEKFEQKDVEYFEEYAKKPDGVRLEVLNTYFAIIDDTRKKIVARSLYEKAEEFINKRDEIIDTNYPQLRGVIEPKTKGDYGLLGFVNFRDSRIDSYGIREIDCDNQDRIVLSVSSSYANQDEVFDQGINIWNRVGDLDTKYVEENIFRDIEKSIKEEINRKYSNGFDLKNNKLMLEERVIYYVLKNYHKEFNINLNKLRPIQQYIPMNLSDIKEKIYKTNLNDNNLVEFPNIKNGNTDNIILDNDLKQEDKILINYIKELENLGINTISELSLPDWNNKKHPKRFFFENYTKEELTTNIKKLYLSIVKEYKKIVENNFRNIMNDFEFCKSLPHKAIFIIDQEWHMITFIKIRDIKNTVRVLFEKDTKNKGFEYYYKRFGKKKNISVTNCSLNRIFKTGYIGWGNIPGEIDVINRTVLDIVENDFSKYKKEIERIRIGSFNLEDVLADNKTKEVFDKLCREAIDKDDLWIEDINNKYNEKEKKEILKLDNMNCFAAAHINILNNPIAVALSNKSLYEYLQANKIKFKKEIKRIKRFIRSKRMKEGISSDQIKKIINVKEIIIRTMLVKYENQGKLSGMININGNYIVNKKMKCYVYNLLKKRILKILNQDD